MPGCGFSETGSSWPFAGPASGELGARGLVVPRFGRPVPLDAGSASEPVAFAGVGDAESKPSRAIGSGGLSSGRLAGDLGAGRGKVSVPRTLAVAPGTSRPGRLEPVGGRRVVSSGPRRRDGLASYSREGAASRSGRWRAFGPADLGVSWSKPGSFNEAEVLRRAVDTAGAGSGTLPDAFVERGLVVSSISSAGPVLPGGLGAFGMSTSMPRVSRRVRGPSGRVGRLTAVPGSRSLGPQVSGNPMADFGLVARAPPAGVCTVNDGGGAVGLVPTSG